MICKDLQPFTIVDGGFSSLAEHFINVGARYGKLNVTDILYDRTTLARKHLMNEYEQCVANICKEMKKVSYVSVTTDHWSDDMVKNAHQSFTVHYLTDDFRLISKCIGLHEFEEAKTAIAVKTKTIEILSRFLPEHLMHSIVFVTNHGSNMKAAYKNDVRVSCAGHNINLVVKNALKHESASDCRDMLKVARELVGYFKHSGHNKELDHTLKQDVSTGWNSQFFMLQSLQGEMDDIKATLEREKHYNKLKLLSNVNTGRTELCNVVDFLHTFHQGLKCAGTRRYCVLALLRKA